MYRKLKFVCFAFFILSSFLLISCGTPTNLSFKLLSKVGSPSVLDWTIEDCENVIKSYTRTNYLDSEGDINTYADLYNDVFISAIPLLPKVIKAIAKKEAILKRLNTDEFFGILDDYLYIYTDYKYDRQFDRLVYTNPNPDSAIGLSFQLKFENRTNPYHPIEVNSGYEYFFLENDTLNFARVVEVGGRYSETDIYLADFLNVTVRFNSKNNRGIPLFKNSSFDDGFKIVFNALQNEPIILNWELKSFNHLSN